MNNDRNVQRINGNIEHLHQWSPQELEAAIGYEQDRISAAEQNIELYRAELLGRIATADQAEALF